MTDLISAPEAATVRVPTRVVLGLDALSRHSACPPECALATALAAMWCRVTGRPRIPVLWEAPDRQQHHHLIEADPITTSMRGALGGRYLTDTGGEDVLRLRITERAGAYSITPERASAPATGTPDPMTHLVAFCEEALRHPDWPLSALSLLDPETRRTVLVDWNATDVAYPQNATLCALVEEQAARTPLSTAVLADGRVVTYRTLDGRANQIAELLRSFGVTPGSLVGVHLGRSADLVAVLLGVLKAGAAYVPLDPRYPAARLQQMITDSGAGLVLSDRAHVETLRQDGIRAVALDGDTAQLLSGLPETGKPNRAVAEDRAYVIYTSGSTGVPKGVQVEHAAVVNFLLGMRDLLGLDAADGVLALTSLSFDIAVLELFAPLVVGGRVVLANDQEAGEPARLAELIRRAGPTVVQATPTTWRMLLDAAEDLPAVTALCGGEPMPAALARRLTAMTDRVWNMYGPTETTVWSTAARITVDDCARPPVGRPIANTAAYVLDEHREPVPIGAVGELWLGGAGVARGYLHRADLTAARFVIDPFRESGRMYRTGDLARYRPDGVIELLGRTDQQVKIAGHRVEPGEVEAALTGLPEVRQAVVTAVRTADGTPELGAFVLPSETAPDPARLRAELARLVPRHLVPTHLTFVSEFPRLPNGKIDRTALGRSNAAAPTRDTAGSAPTAAAPRTQLTDVEAALAARWRDVLPNPPPDIHTTDDFFALGGTSLRATTLIGALSRLTNDVLYVAALFRAPTLGGFARYLEREYPGLIRALAGSGQAASESDRGLGVAEHRLIDTATARHFAELVSGPPPVVTRQPVTPEPAFILSAPRSGSTLLRVMLAGSPRLFVPPELELLGFDDMATRAAAFTGAHSYADEGLLRAVRELLGCDPAQARAFVDAHRHLTVGDFYGKLTALLDGRLVVDKTSTYAMDSAALRRAEQLFDGARYIHLVRHPAAMVSSYLDARLEQVFRYPHDLSPRTLAELIWLTSNQTVEEFFVSVPAARRLTVRFEDLMGDTRGVIDRIAGFLGIPVDEAMLDPYDGQAARMVDGLHPQSRMAGDVKFTRFGRIEKAVTDAWRTRFDPAGLSPLTRALGRRHGYTDLGPDPVTRSAPLADHQRNVYLHQQVAAHPSLYNICKAWLLEGPLDLLTVRAAMQYVLDRHEALRTVLRERGDLVEQVVTAGGALALDRLPLGAGATGDQIREALGRYATTTLDLAAGPLMRVGVAALAPDRHVFAVLVHHAVADGTSVALLLRDFSQAYAAVSTGREPDLPPVGQYLDVAAAATRRPGRAAALGYWRRALDGAPELLTLPSDQTRPAGKRYRGERVPVAVAAQTWQRLTELARDQSATPFIVLLSGFVALLVRYSAANRPDPLVVGTAFVDRQVDGADNVVGMFTGTLPLPVPVAGDPTFRDLVARVRTTCLGAYEHHQVPFEDLVRESGLARDVSHGPLVQVLFTFEPELADELRLAGIRVTGVDVPGHTAKFDLTLSLVPGDRGLTGYWEFDEDLYDAAQIRRMDRHYDALLAAVAADPDQPVGTYRFLDDDEVDLVVRRWNDTGGAVEPASALDLIRRQAEHRPHAPAVQGAGQSVSYAQLDAASDAIAEQLRARGVRPGEVVAVICDREPSFVVACLGVLKSGAAYLPIDPASPRKRQEYMVRDSAARFVLAAPEREIAAVPEVTVLRIDTAARPAGPVPILAGADDLAYVIYTSGSTGRPKGVMVERRSLDNFVQWYAERYALTGNDRVGQTANVGFDVCAMDVWPTLAAGATLVIAPGEALVDPAVMWQWLADSRLAVSFVVTPLFEAMLAEAVPPGLTLRTVVVAGDRLHAHPAMRDLPFQLVNGYGPTENTILSTVELVTGDAAVRPPAIGRPVPNTTTYVLDERLRPVPVGVEGELYLGGAQVARGYLGRPELTAQRFIADPFSERPGATLFRTGDRVRHRADGTLEFLGRNDDQVKIRGFRIELGEVEAAVKQVAGVRDAVVLAYGEGHDRQLRAWYVGATDLTVASLAQTLRRELPGYLVPAQFVQIDAIPVTSNGKVDRRALAAIPVSAPDSEPAELAEPATGFEADLLAMWREVLGTDRVGVDDSFFEQGGHSLSAMRLVSRIRERTGRQVTLPALFAAPTARALAGVLAADESAPDCLVELQPLGDRPPLVCVHPSDGTVLAYQPLRSLCAPHQPVWGIQATANTDASIESMASRYVDALLDRAGANPLHLLGWSFGGLVAFEVARQWEALGAPVGSLTLLDAEVLTRVGRPEDDEDLLLREFRWQLRRRFVEAPEVSRDTREPDAPGDWAALVAEAVRQSWIDGPDAEPELRRAYRIFRDHLAMGRRYRPKPVAVPFTLYVVQARTAGRRAAQIRAWEELGAVTVREIPGDHMDAVSPEALTTVVAEHERAGCDR